MFLFSCNFLFAQTGKLVKMIDLEAMASKSTRPASQWYNQPRNTFIEGSQYLDELWEDGTLILKNDTLIEGLKFRYNIYAHEMQLRIKEDTLAFTRPDLIRTLVFKNRTFIYGEYTNNKITGKDYFELLVDGKYNLLLKREVTFIPQSPPSTPLSGGYLYDRMILKEYIYLQKNGSDAIFVKSNKKSILSQLGDHQSELLKYIQKEKISFKENKDIAKLIIYYNSLS